MVSLLYLAEYQYSSETLKIVTDKKYAFFVSHSTRDFSDYVGKICEVFEKCKLPSFVADRDAPVGKSLPEEIRRAIEDSEILLVFVTTNSKKSPWVNQEIGYALGKNIPVIPIKKGNVKIEGLVETTKYVKMQDNPLETVKEFFSRLKGIPINTDTERAIIAIVGALEMKEKYGGR